MIAVDSIPEKGAHREHSRRSFLAEVFEPQTLAALDRVRLRVGRASGERPGNTPVRGRSDPTGTELDRHVPYSPGDDLRYVDWASFARLDQLLTRRFVAEREVPVWILIDDSGSMSSGIAGGPPACSPGDKFDVARAIAAVFACVALSGGDRVHLVCLGEAIARPGAARLGPLTGRRRLAEVHRFLEQQHPGRTPFDLAAALDSVLRTARGGLVVLISDFLSELSAVARCLDSLAARRCEAKLIQVLSRQDLDPSWLHGVEELIDRETGEVKRLKLDDEAMAKYRAVLDVHQTGLRRLAAHRQMAMTLQATDEALRTFLRVELPRLGLGLVR